MEGRTGSREFTATRSHACRRHWEALSIFADYSEEIPAQGAVAVTGIATGDIETSPDRDWFAVELVAGRSCRFDLQGIPGGGTLADTCPRASDDSPGRFQSGHDNSDNGNRRREVTEQPAGDAAAWVSLTGRR